VRLPSQGASKSRDAESSTLFAADSLFVLPALTYRRTLFAATLVESALCHGGLLGFEYVIYGNQWIFSFPPQLWRLVSPFLVTGGGFSFVFDLFFCELHNDLLMGCGC